MVPNFFILGAARCGTTALHHYLRQHSDFCMSNPKEPFFFEGEFRRGLEWYGEHYFAHFRDERFIGDAAHRNLYVPWAAEHIKEVCPLARFIVLVRNPIERAISHWWYYRVRSKEMDDFETAIKKDMRRIELGTLFDPDPDASRRLHISTAPGYVPNGHYAEMISRYDRLFGRDRVLVVLTDDLAANPNGTLKRVLEFLDAPPFRFTSPATVNSSANPIGIWLSAYYMRWKNVLHRLRIARHPQKTRHDAIERAILRVFGRHQPNARPETLALLRRHYAPHNELLSNRIGRDLSDWNN